MTSSTTTYPRKDSYQRATFWTGPVSAADTHVTGFKRFEGARTTYYVSTCTCGARGEQRLDLAACEADALAHAATHVAAL